MEDHRGRSCWYTGEKNVRNRYQLGRSNAACAAGFMRFFAVNRGAKQANYGKYGGAGIRLRREKWRARTSVHRGSSYRVSLSHFRD
jgi:hypothetical protein